MFQTAKKLLFLDSPKKKNKFSPLYPLFKPVQGDLLLKKTFGWEVFATFVPQICAPWLCTGLPS